MSTITIVSRRGFLTAAGGLVLGVVLPERSKLEAQQFGGGVLPGAPAAIKPSAYIHIGTDDTVTFLITKSELGQGPMTSLSQILADELDCDWSKVRTEFAPVDTTLYGPVQGVVGSMSIRTLWSPLRRVGATGRAMLIDAAAQKWGIDKSQCRTESGFVINTSTNDRLSYGSLTDAAASLPVPANIQPKDPKDFKIIATPVKRLDTRDKASGRAKFGIDSRLPGMVYAVVERCPVFGGKVVSFDATKAKAVPGVKDVIQISSGVAVIADNTWSAVQGRRALQIQWDEGAGAQFNTPGISKMFADLTQQPGANARKEGAGADALASGAKTLEAVYEAPFLSHATMEPMNCTADVKADGCDLWASTQMQTPSRDTAAQILGLPKDKVRVHTQFVGGGFGRRARTDFIVEAVQISKVVGVPVKVTWSREDDMQHDWYRPAAYVKLRAALDADGWPTAYCANIACQPFPAVDKLSRTAVEGFDDMRYKIPNMQIDYHMATTHVPVSYWRSVGHSQNGFFIESFIDEMAAASGKDPVEFRRRLLAGTPRMLGVLNLVAEKAGWGTPLPKGRFRGVSVINNIGSFNAQVAEISIDHGKLKVHRVVCAVDCGHHVNPMILRQQIEGGMVYGLAAALKGEITIDRGRVQQSNFDTYDVLRIDEMPQVEVHIVASTEAPGGIGEAATPGIAPAVANAVFAATGKRIRKLPIRAADLA